MGLSVGTEALLGGGAATPRGKVVAASASTYGLCARSCRDYDTWRGAQGVLPRAAVFPADVDWPGEAWSTSGVRLSGSNAR